MKEPDNATQVASAFWQGLALGIAFRTFSYGLLSALYLSSAFWKFRGLPPSLTSGLFLAYWFAATSSLLWVPLVSGFISAYFWRHLDASACGKAIWLSIFIGIPILIVAATWLGAGNIIFAFPMLFYVEFGMCGYGVALGSKFWKHRLSRQMLGDFSTDAWQEDS